MSTMDVVRAQGRDGLVVPFAKVNQVFPNSPAAAAVSAREYRLTGLYCRSVLSLTTSSCDHHA